MYNFMNLDDYVSYITSENIHTLGIKAGDKVYLNYFWEEIEEMFKDRIKNRTQFLDTKDLELVVIVMEDYVPNIEDIIGDTKEIL